MSLCPRRWLPRFTLPLAYHAYYRRKRAAETITAGVKKNVAALPRIGPRISEPDRESVVLDIFHTKFTFASSFRNYMQVTVIGRSSPPEASLVFHPTGRIYRREWSACPSFL